MKVSSNKKVITTCSRPASRNDHACLKPSIQGEFKTFVSKYCPRIDIHATPNNIDGKAISHWRVPTSPIRQGVLESVASIRDSHFVRVFPTSRFTTDRNHLVPIQAPLEFTAVGMRHLRIEAGQTAYLWFVTQDAYNTLEAHECSFWLMSRLGISWNFPAPISTGRLSVTPLPIADTNTTATFIDGAVLKLAGHAERMDFLDRHRPAGWNHELFSAQNTQLLEQWRSGEQDAIFLPYKDAFMLALNRLASGDTSEVVTDTVANFLQNTLAKYRNSRANAMWQANKIISGILKHRPTIEGSFDRQAVIERFKAEGSTPHLPSNWAQLTPAQKWSHYKDNIFKPDLL